MANSNKFWLIQEEDYLEEDTMEVDIRDMVAMEVDMGVDMEADMEVDTMIPFLE